jgi:FMN phosphatase YigB (HAD superfamily)
LITTLLIDLDDTLLHNPMDAFLAAYLQKLGRHMANHADPSKFVDQLMRSTGKMLANEDPCITLERAFADDFYPTLGLNEDDVRPQIDIFYEDIFPTLKSLTHPVDGARDLIEHARAMDLHIVIATNPLFPHRAIEHRLNWAGIDDPEHDYDLVTSYECFHFTKPRPDYYAEILGRLGAVPHQAAMIGNDISDDLLPARSLGLAVFHVTQDGNPDFPSGTLKEAIVWLEQQAPQDIIRKVSQSQVLPRLKGHLAALRGMTLGPTEFDWTRRPEENEWAPVEIVCHLRDVEAEVTLPRVEAILSKDKPHLSAPDTDQWADERDYIEQDGPAAVEAFTQNRCRIIDLVQDISNQQWARTGRHALLGPTTLDEIISVTLDHDLLHLAQLRAAISPHCT